MLRLFTATLLPLILSGSLLAVAAETGPVPDPSTGMGTGGTGAPPPSSGHPSATSQLPSEPEEELFPYIPGTRPSVGPNDCYTDQPACIGLGILRGVANFKRPAAKVCQVVYNQFGPGPRRVSGKFYLGPDEALRFRGVYGDWWECNYDTQGEPGNGTERGWFRGRK